MSDLISRQAAIDAVHKEFDDCIVWDESGMTTADEVERILDGVPSAQPEINQWCTDCKEYDKEKHHCPRFNRVIREALKDAEPRKTGKWELLPLSIIPPVYKCSACGRHAVWITTGCLVNRHEESYLSDFCPHCGADMREKNERIT